MMAAAAFTQAQGSLRWFVDNFSAIADWRATLLRVANFRAALVATESQHDAGSRIEYAEGAPGAMAFENLEVDSPVGREGFEERHVVIRRRRARADLRSARRGQDAAVPRALGPVAVGQRPHRSAARRSRDVRAARHAVSAARHAARSARLPVAHGQVRRARYTCRRSSARASARYAKSLDADQPLGPRAQRGRADGIGARPRGAARPALGRVRRHVLFDGGRDARARHRHVHARRRRRRRSFTSGAARRRMCRCSSGCCI